MIDTTRLGHWGALPFFGAPWTELAKKLDAEARPILPPAPQVFAALENLAPSDVRVVILGQDPYPTPGHAHGFAFSAQADTHPLPKSLNNIFKEMRDDLGDAPESADIRFWAAQGVLLLNSVLTTPAGDAGGHRGWGWEGLLADVMAHLDPTPRAFLLWGKDAQATARFLHRDHHLILASPHPSPLSAYRGFFGSRPFSTVNAWLKRKGEREINWTSPL